ncbi:MAG TPA: CAP domain-containing protein [Actinomycetota bacterium]
MSAALCLPAALTLLGAGSQAVACTQVVGVTLGDDCDGGGGTKRVKQGKARDAETTLFQSANRARSDQGLAPLRSDSAAQAVARDYAQVMWRRGTLRHNPDLRSPATMDRLGHPAAVAENVGKGPRASSIHRAFMRSPGHRANILTSLPRLGIGAYWDGKTVWAVQVFLGPGGAWFAPSSQSALPAAHGGAHARAGSGGTLLPGEGLASLPDAAAAEAPSGPGPTPWLPIGIAFVAVTVPGASRALWLRLRRA